MLGFRRKAQAASGWSFTEADVQRIDHMATDIEALAERMRRMTNAAWFRYRSARTEDRTDVYPPPFDEYGPHMQTAIDTLEKAKDVLGDWFGRGDS